MEALAYQIFPRLLQNGQSPRPYEHKGGKRVKPSRREEERGELSIVRKEEGHRLYETVACVESKMIR